MTDPNTFCTRIFIIDLFYRALEDGSFLTQVYVVLHINTYCCGELGKEWELKYYPAELGAVGFSLAGGLMTKVASAIIDPGPIPYYNVRYKISRFRVFFNNFSSSSILHKYCIIS